MHINDATIVLTGAGSGIGRALALALSAKGARLVLADLNEEGLKETKRLLSFPEQAHLVHADVTNPSDRKALVEKVEREFGELKILINNAGVLFVGPLQETNDEALELMTKVNLLAPMALCRDFTGLLKKARPSRIVNIGSMFGDIAFPLFAGYSATKFAMRGLSDALRRELKAEGIEVTYVAPRAAKTGATGAFEHLIKPMKMKLDAPEVVAGNIVAAIENDARSAYPKGGERFFVLVQRLFPVLVDGDIVKQLASVENGKR
ncbi:MAG: SDR family NAD(P)-dependent oxidoreductase [Rhodospirillales bacterium]|nr:SDR family NAD(P)-dependent oxidoreductase [Rhodospirillales bacterium]